MESTVGPQSQNLRPSVQEPNATGPTFLLSIFVLVVGTLPITPRTIGIANKTATPPELVPTDCQTVASITPI